VEHEDRVPAHEIGMGQLRDAELVRTEQRGHTTFDAELLGVDEPRDRNRRIGIFRVEHEAQRALGRKREELVELRSPIVEGVLDPVLVQSEFSG